MHNETATGVTSDIAAVRRAIDAAIHPALFYVDGVSSVASLDFRFDEWKIDFAIAGSQKGFMMPPGIGLLCVSRKALGMLDQAKCPRAFFDLRDQIKHNAEGYFPYTPPIAHLFGLRAALDLLLEEGMAGRCGAPSPPRRGRAAGRRRLGPRALRPRPGHLLGYRLGGGRARRRRREEASSTSRSAATTSRSAAAPAGSWGRCSASATSATSTS